MSAERCEQHQMHWDSDCFEMCPKCAAFEDYEPTPMQWRLEVESLRRENAALKKALQWALDNGRTDLECVCAYPAPPALPAHEDGCKWNKARTLLTGAKDGE